MKVQAVLYFCLLLTIHCSFIKGDRRCYTTKSSSMLSCTRFTQIPKSSQTSFDHTLTGILDLSSQNQLHTIKTGEFIQAGFINVKVILINDCNIRTIESSAFRDLEALVEVHLQNNLIESLNMQMFENNDRLQILLLNGNPIHQFIGTQFPKLPLLGKIDLDDGSITQIPIKAFENLENLEEIDLRNNKIRRLDWTTFQYSQKLTKVFLANNEWECDCHMHFLDIFLYEKKIDIEPHITCKAPEKFANIKLNDIPVQELTCPPQITALNPIGPGAYQGSDNDDVIIYSETGKDIGLDCAVDGYPKPEIVWIKDDKLVQPQYEVIGPDTRSSVMRPEFKHTFTKHLAIYNASKNDIGTYKCVTYQYGKAVNYIRRSVFLNLTNVPILTIPRTTIEEMDEIQSTPWMWILISASALALTPVLITIIVSKWRNYQKTRSDKRFLKRTDRIMKEPSGLVTYVGPQPRSEDDPYSQILIS